MTELDDKLTSILNDAHKMNWRLDPLLAQIKQAFADAGYDRCVAMTGQEWYDRFSQQFRGTPGGTVVTLNIDEIMKAAKRASGIEETR